MNKQDEQKTAIKLDSSKLLGAHWVTGQPQDELDISGKKTALR